MALNYGKLVPDADQITILEQRLAARGMEAWQHSLNLEDAIAAGDTETITIATAALDKLDAAILADRKRLNKLGRNLPLT